MEGFVLASFRSCHAGGPRRPGRSTPPTYPHVLMDRTVSCSTTWCNTIPHLPIAWWPNHIKSPGHMGMPSWFPPRWSPRLKSLEEFAGQKLHKNSLQKGSCLSHRAEPVEPGASGWNMLEPQHGRYREVMSNPWPPVLGDQRRALLDRTVEVLHQQLLETNLNIATGSVHVSRPWLS